MSRLSETTPYAESADALAQIVHIVVIGWHDVIISIHLIIVSFFIHDDPPSKIPPIHSDHSRGVRWKHPTNPNRELARAFKASLSISCHQFQKKNNTGRERQTYWHRKCITN